MNVCYTVLAAQQIAALESIRAWLDSDIAAKQTFRLYGYAGTGKTTLAQQAARLVDDDVIYAALTGKAAFAMILNGCHDARTLHSLLYKPIDQGNGTVRFSPRDDSLGAPDMLLTEIHRRAAGNPIIDLATRVRSGLPLEIGIYGASRVIPKSDLKNEDLLGADQIIVGKNDSRRTINALVREERGFSGGSRQRETSWFARRTIPRPACSMARPSS